VHTSCAWDVSDGGDTPISWRRALHEYHFTAAQSIISTTALGRNSILAINSDEILTSSRRALSLKSMEKSFLNGAAASSTRAIALQSGGSSLHLQAHAQTSR
jgi:hypothetical protein